MLIKWPQLIGCAFHFETEFKKGEGGLYHLFLVKNCKEKEIEMTKKNILKFHRGLQRYLLTCLANSALLRRFFFALDSSNSEGHR